MPRRSWLPCLLTLREFIVVDQQIHAAGGGIDPDTVAFADQRQWAANERFRRDVADAHPACRARKAPIGNECDLLSHALAVNQRRDAQHLPHAGTADRAFIANDENIPAAYWRLRTAWTHCSSSSNTRAEPSNTRLLRPATLMTAPAGQRLPFRTA